MARNRYYDGPRSDHFDGTRFFVPGHPFAKSRLDLLRWLFGGGRSSWPAQYDGEGQTRPEARVEGGRLVVTSIGHASVLIQTRGMNLLVDPVWSERASPFRRFGPRRVNPPGVRFEDLPPIDVVLVSHNHYDHLDVATLRRLAAAHRPRVITPLGNDRIIGAAVPGLRVESHDWGDRVVLSDELALHLEPTHHWSARGFGDRSMALWAAFVIETPDGQIYHVADTGYRDGALFRAAGARHAPIRLAILPIGAYEPRWFMADQHVNPEEAVRLFRDCGAEQALAHHWGTFRLTNEAIDAPPAALAAALEEAGIAPDRFAVRRPGGILELGPR